MSAPTLGPGTRFGSYEIIGALGQGAFGTVYEAIRHPLRKRVALKVLGHEMVGAHQAVARFLREAETAAQLQHPHIVDVQDLGSCDGVPYLAMELLVGETLEDRVEREGRLSVETAVDLALPVLSAVAAMHDRGYIHRDLKPANVFITQGPHGDHPKVLDFGIVKIHRHDSSLTRTASLLGTPSFMAPEQVREARDIDERADVWSLAVLLYVCVTGAPPFLGETMFETFDRIMHDPLVPPGARVGGVPPGFDAVILQAMKRESSARTASVRELGHALLPFASPMARLAWSREFERPISSRPVVTRREPSRVAAPTLPESAPPEPTLAEGPLRVTRWSAARVGLLLLAATAAVVLTAAGVVMSRGRAAEPVLAGAPSAEPVPPTPIVLPPVPTAAEGEREAPTVPARETARRRRRRSAGGEAVIGNY